MNYKHYIASKLNIEGMDTDAVASCIEVPPNNDLGDFALPCFKFAKVLRKSPVMIAEELSKTDKVSSVNTNLDNGEIFAGGIHCSTLDLVREDEYIYYV